MLASCICVCHKKKIAHEAIESVLAQTHQEWELVVFDSGELYDAGYYNKYTDPRIKLIRSTETDYIRRTKAMAPWCFNECFRRGLVTGDIVSYISDDDILYDNFFETFVQFFTSNPDAKAAYASQDIGVISPDGSRLIIGERRALEAGGKHGVLMDCRVDMLQFCHRIDIINMLNDPWWCEDKGPPERHADGIFMERVGQLFPVMPIDIKVSQNRRTPESIYNPS